MYLEGCWILMLEQKKFQDVFQVESASDNNLHFLV